MAAAVVGIAWGELAMMHAQTVAQFTLAGRWIQVPIFAIVLGIVLFLRLYFGTGRLWLAAAAVVTRLLVLAVNFVVSPNVSYREVRAILRTEFLGQTVTVADGLYNPWIWLGRASSLLVCAFAVDAAVTYWRRADADTRRRAWTVAGSLAFFLFAATVHAALIQHGLIESPSLISPFFLVAVGAMGTELTRDVARAMDLSRQLHESEERVTLATEVAQLGVWDWDPRDDRVWATDRARELFGLDSAGKTTLGQLLDQVYPEDRDTLRRGIERAMGGNGGFQVDCRVAGPGAAVRWLANRGRVDVAAGPGRRRLRSVSVDITERRRTEAEARQSREEIAHLSRVALANELSGSLAHELNQPLGAILSNAQAMRRLLASGSPDLDEIRAILDDIVADDQHAGEVIRRVRLLLRKGEPQWEVLDVPDVARQVLQLARRELADRSIAVRTDMAGSLPVVRGDRVQLQQVLLNLVMNAIDAMADTPLADRALEIGVERGEDGGVRVSMSDTGRGVPTAMGDRVFEPFVTTKVQGMGMGLAICRSIVGAHGGRLWTEEKGDAGARFVFTLPSEDEPAG